MRFSNWLTDGSLISCDKWLANNYAALSWVELAALVTTFNLPKSTVRFPNSNSQTLPSLQMAFKRWVGYSSFKDIRKGAFHKSLGCER